MRHEIQRRLTVPALVCIRRNGFGCQLGFEHLVQSFQVVVHVETDLDLESLKTEIACFLHEFRSVLDVDAACVGRHHVCRIAIHEMP